MMNNFNCKKLFNLEFVLFVVLFILCSVFKPSTQDLYKLLEEEYLSLDEIELLNNYRSHRYTRQANDINQSSGVQQSSLCGINSDNNKDIVRAKRGDFTQGTTDWPWVAVLLEKSGRNQFCGGALLNRKYILTAAHCFQGPGISRTKDDVVVRLGEWDLIQLNETIYQEANVIDLKIHEDYDSSTQKNDIALIKLDRSIQYTQFVRPICLPTKVPEENETVTVAGWGAIKTNGDHSTVLLDVQVPIVSHDHCIFWYAAETNIFEDTNICAGGTIGKDSCTGDSGGPLLYKESSNDRWTTVGIVSWGMNCGEYMPAVYTNVKYYLSWIGIRIADSSP